MKFIKNFKKVYKFSYGYRRYIVLYLIMSLITCLFGIIIPIISALQLVNLTNGLWDKVIFCTLFLFGMNIFNAFISFILSFSFQKFSKLVISKIQIRLGREILKIQVSDIDKNSNGVFIERLTRDAGNISSIFTFGISTLTSIIKNLGVTIIIFTINVWIGLLFLVFLVLYMILQRIRIKTIDKRDRSYREQREKTSGFSTELIRGIRDIKMLNTEDAFMNKAEESILLMNQKSYDVSYVNRLFWIIDDIIYYTFELLLVILIVFSIKNGKLDLAFGIVIFNYRYSVNGLVSSINSILDYVRDFNLSCERVFSLFEGSEFKKEKFGNKHLDKIEGNFSFRDVTFGYNDNIVLDKISFDIKANETVAFVGKSGAGKTTIFNLLCKLYDVNSGSITIDGININELDKDSIRGNITIISQNPYIFNMSIRDNLKLVKEDLTEEEMISACKMACLDDFINSLDNGYDTIVGEGGVLLSGGQRQRLAIARAMVQKTEIILFDEATSSLDNETQSSIQKAIYNMKSDYTILLIAHRLSTIIDCDRILFIEDGKVVDSGTHSELLKRNAHYKKLYESEIIDDKS